MAIPPRDARRIIEQAIARVSRVVEDEVKRAIAGAFQDAAMIVEQQEGDGVGAISAAIRAQAKEAMK